MQTIQPSLAENRVSLNPVSWETFSNISITAGSRPEEK